jgi:hypothetical protein
VGECSIEVRMAAVSRLYNPRRFVIQLSSTATPSEAAKVMRTNAEIMSRATHPGWTSAQSESQLSFLRSASLVAAGQTTSPELSGVDARTWTSGTSTITGVVESADQPIPGATTAIQGTIRVVTTTGQDGRYSLPQLGDGTWIVEVMMVGFQLSKKTLTVSNANQELDFTLRLKEVRTVARHSGAARTGADDYTGNELELQVQNEPESPHAQHESLELDGDGSSDAFLVSGSMSKGMAPNSAADNHHIRSRPKLSHAVCPDLEFDHGVLVSRNSELGAMLSAVMGMEGKSSPWKHISNAVLHYPGTGRIPVIQALNMPIWKEVIEPVTAEVRV